MEQPPTPPNPFESPQYPMPEEDSIGLLLIVVGAHLRAELMDRPLAYQVQQAILQWQENHAEHLNVGIQPIVCSDIWYLNQPDFQKRPTICLGGPSVNALSAYFAKQIAAETDAPLDDDEPKVLLQIDPEFTELRCCLWGTDHDLTARGVDMFLKNYLDEYLKAVVTQVEPSTE